MLKRHAHQSCKREDGFETSHSTLPATDEVHEALAVMSLLYLIFLSRDSIRIGCTSYSWYSTARISESNESDSIC